MRAVFDTNVYISAFITPGGQGEGAFLAAVDGRCQLITSIPILTETARVLTDKFGWDQDHVTQAVRHISAVANTIRPRHRLAVLADEPDNRILECALSGRAHVIVTSDKHLLSLTRFEAIRVTALAAFLEDLERRGF